MSEDDPEPEAEPEPELPKTLMRMELRCHAYGTDCVGYLRPEPDRDAYACDSCDMIIAGPRMKHEPVAPW